MRDAKAHADPPIIDNRRHRRREELRNQMQRADSTSTGIAIRPVTGGGYWDDHLPDVTRQGRIALQLRKDRHPDWDVEADTDA